MTPIKEAFEAHLQAMPEWAPEFEVHRPWVEKLLLDAWNAATERAAKLCDAKRAAYLADPDAKMIAVFAAQDCAAAIRGDGGGK